MPTFQNPTGRVMACTAAASCSIWRGSSTSRCLRTASITNCASRANPCHRSRRWMIRGSSFTPAASPRTCCQECASAMSSATAPPLRAAGARQTGRRYFDARPEPARYPLAARTRGAGAAVGAQQPRTAPPPRCRAGRRRTPPAGGQRAGPSPQGGLYLWIELPKSGPTAAELYISAIQQGVAYAIGSVFYPTGGGSYRLRMNYAAQTPVRN